MTEEQILGLYRNYHVIMEEIYALQHIYECDIRMYKGHNSVL